MAGAPGSRGGQWSRSYPRTDRRGRRRAGRACCRRSDPEPGRRFAGKADRLQGRRIAWTRTISAAAEGTCSQASPRRGRAQCDLEGVVGEDPEGPPPAREKRSRRRKGRSTPTSMPGRPLSPPREPSLPSPRACPRSHARWPRLLAPRSSQTYRSHTANPCCAPLQVGRAFRRDRSCRPIHDKVETRDVERECEVGLVVRNREPRESVNMKASRSLGTPGRGDVRSSALTRRAERR